MQNMHEIGSQVLLYGANASVGTSINITGTVILLIATALVLFMVPGLAIFYGGLVRRKNVSTIIAQSFISMTIVTLIWIFGGFSLAFGSSAGGFIGNPADYFLFRNILFGNGWKYSSLVVNITLANGVPFIAFFLFQLAFAIITPALVTGAFADCLNYHGYILFTILFTIFIYIPVCHWIWGGGWLSTNGAIDWAGGVVIHATCGMAAICSVFVLKRREILGNEQTVPHSLPLVTIGAAILLFGWFGFNTGGATYAPSNLTAEAIKNHITAGTLSTILPQNELLFTGLTAFANSFLAMTCAIAAWTIMDIILKRHTSLTSILTAAIAGLATITPAAGFVPIWASLAIGFIGGLMCYTMCKLNHKAHFDDALEVWPVHGVGGVTGAILVAAFASSNVNPVLLTASQHITANVMGSALLLGWQLAMIIVVCVWTAVFSVGVFYLIVYFKGKVSNEQQIEGLDHVLFDEDAYSKGVVKQEVVASPAVLQDIAPQNKNQKSKPSKVKNSTK